MAFKNSVKFLGFFFFFFFLFFFFVLKSFKNFFKFLFFFFFLILTVNFCFIPFCCETCLISVVLFYCENLHPCINGIQKFCEIFGFFFFFFFFIFFFCFKVI